MRILFDNNSFAYLVQNPQNEAYLNKLKQLVDTRKVEVIGSVTLLQELSGLADSNSSQYLHTLLEYEKITNGKILRKANELLKKEIDELSPIFYEQSLMDKKEIDTLFSNLKKPHIANLLFFNETQVLKSDYSQTLDNAVASVLSHPALVNETPKAIREGFKKLFGNFDVTAQGWFDKMLNDNKSFPFKKLPHISAFLGYSITRVYERMVLNIKDRNNDFFDRDYFIDSSIVDFLVTEDRIFMNTALRVPNRTFKVVDLNKLFLVLNRL